MRTWKKMMIISLFLMLIAFLVFQNRTEKVNWKEKNDENSFTATFDYFDGSHLIPVTCKKGEYISYDVLTDFKEKYDNGKLAVLTDSLLEPNKRNEGQDPSGKTLLTKIGTYYIKIEGTNMSGYFKVNWICE